MEKTENSPSLTGDEARLVVHGDHVDWTPVVNTMALLRHDRWSVTYTGVFYCKPLGRYFRFEWDKPASECQDSCPFDYVHKYCPQEVVRREVTRHEWVPV